MFAHWSAPRCRNLEAEGRLEACGRSGAPRTRRGPQAGHSRLQLAFVLGLVSPGTAHGKNLDIRVSKGMYHRGYKFMRVSALSEQPEAPGQWAPSFRMLDQGLCSDISYLPITSASLCREALSQADPAVELLDMTIRYTTAHDSPFGCFFLEDTQQGKGQLWIGSPFGLSHATLKPASGEGIYRHTLCRSQAYQAGFFYRWTGKTLHTEVIRVSQEGTSVFIGGQELRLQLHPEGHGVTGVLFSDPCFSSGNGIECANGQKMQVLERLTRVLNVLLASDEIQFWAILGNNFYDQAGDLSNQFFEKLSLSAKLKPLLTVPGNRDFWIGGHPPSTSRDSMGYGFMQYYGQDTEAATPALPFNFSGASPALQLPKAQNFIFGTQIGDLAFFGYSGAHPWGITEPYIQGFCNYVGETKTVNAVVLLGHWSKDDAGCHPGMDVPSVHMRMKRMNGCRGKKVLFFAGHTHCNRVFEKHGGFLIGGAGMIDQDHDCSQFGFTVLQSDPDALLGPDVAVDYFPIAEEVRTDSGAPVLEDHYDELIECLEAEGYSGCRAKHGVPFRSIVTSTTTTTTVSTTTFTTTSSNASTSMANVSGALGGAAAGLNSSGASSGGKPVGPTRMPASIDLLCRGQGCRRVIGGNATAPVKAPKAAKQSLAHRLPVLEMCVGAAALLCLGLAVWAWFWISWKKHTRKGKLLGSPRRVNTPSRGGFLLWAEGPEDHERETVNTLGRLGQKAPDHSYAPLSPMDRRVTPSLEGDQHPHGATHDQGLPPPSPSLNSKAGANRPVARRNSPSEINSLASPPPSPAGALGAPASGHPPPSPGKAGKPPSPMAGRLRPAPLDGAAGRAPFPASPSGRPVSPLNKSGSPPSKAVGTMAPGRGAAAALAGKAAPPAKKAAPPQDAAAPKMASRPRAPDL